MSDETTTPASEPTQAEAAASEIASLKTDTAFQADFMGENGRPAQIAASERKSALTKAAHGPADEPAPELPQQVQDGLKAPDNVSKAAAEAMVPGASPNDYQFNWSEAATTDLNVLQDMNATAAEAAFEVGASPSFAKATVDGLQDMMARSTGPATEATLEAALQRHFGSNADATVTDAKATLAKMPERARQWVLDATDHLDGDGASWLIGRLASVTKATAPKP